MNEWAQRSGKGLDRRILDLMRGHSLRKTVERAYDRAAYLTRGRELAAIWADMLSDRLPDPVALPDRPTMRTARISRPYSPDSCSDEFCDK